jgi:hypothetical protein
VRCIHRRVAAIELLHDVAPAAVAAAVQGVVQ